MKLIFYFMRGRGEAAEVVSVVREAMEDLATMTKDKGTPNERDVTEPIGYNFETIHGYGRPFSYIQAKAVGEVYQDMYQGYSPALCLLYEERDKAKECWKKYFEESIKESNEKTDRLRAEMQRIEGEGWMVEEG